MSFTQYETFGRESVRREEYKEDRAIFVWS